MRKTLYFKYVLHKPFTRVYYVEFPSIMCGFRIEICSFPSPRLGLPEDVQPTAFAAALLNFWGVGDARLHSGVLVKI